jgi:hypothetical protein
MRALAVAVLLATLAAGCTSAPSPSASPLLVEPGADVGSPYLPSLAVRDDGSLDIHAVGVPGATLRMGDVFRVTNRGDAPLVVAFDLPDPDPSWSVGLDESVLSPGETRVGWLVLALPESGASASRTQFAVHVLLQE